MTFVPFLMSFLAGVVVASFFWITMFILVFAERPDKLKVPVSDPRPIGDEKCRSLFN